MKLLEIYKLIEIGDRVIIPKDAQYTVKETNGKISFEVSGMDYIVSIMVPVKSENTIALTIDFFTTKDTGDYQMTNMNEALRVLSMVVGSLEGWLKEYKQKFDIEELQLAYIKYQPKSEESELNAKKAEDGAINKRDSLYRAFIQKFAKRYGSSVKFFYAGGTIAQFNPMIKI